MTALLIPILISTLGAHPAMAQDDDGGSSSGGLGDIDDLLDEIDLGGAGSGPSSAELISYSGGLDQSAPDFAAGKTVSITHTTGDVTVYCQDRQGISARIRYDLRGTDGPALERLGKGIGMRTWGSSSSGGVTTRVPGASSTVKEKDIDLTVNLPPQANVKVSASRGRVEVVGCEGQVTITAGDGVFVSGVLARLTATTSRGDAKVELSPASALTSTNKVSAARGRVSLELPSDYAGRIYAKAEDVSVWHRVDGTNSPGLVQGTVGGGGSASLTVTAASSVDIGTP